MTTIFSKPILASNSNHYKNRLTNKKILFITAAVLRFAGVPAHAEILVLKDSHTLGEKLVPQLAEVFKAKPRHDLRCPAEGATT